MKLKSNVCFIILVFLTLNCFLFTIPAHTVYAEVEGKSTTVETLPSEYCMRDEYIVYAQSQDSLGYCWNFASTMAASTTIMKATGEYYDFSELWTGIALNNCTTKHGKIGAGGTISYQYDAMKESGLMLECDLPYQYSYTASSENAADYYNFYEKHSNDDLADCLVTDKDTSFSSSEVDEIKRHIYEHGSVYMSFVFRTGFIDGGGAYYLEPNQTDTSSNHAVSVIGWDDNYEREFYLNGSSTPTVFKGAWIILNSYTEKNGKDGISLIFYDDNNIGVIQGYRYEPNTDKDLYFYDRIENGYSYPTALKGKYYGDFSTEAALTKQKNIFYDDVELEYSYVASEGAEVKRIDIYLDGKNVTDRFEVNIDNESNRFYISADNAAYGQHKLLVTYGNGEEHDTYLNNFFVTHGLIGEEIEYDYESNSFSFNPGRDLEFHSLISSDKNYVIYTDKLCGEVTFLPTAQSVYSEKNMSLPKLSYEITNGESVTSTYVIKSDSGYELEYNFTFVYCSDTSLQPVRVYYDLGGGINNAENYHMELAGPDSDLVLYEPTRSGYTFAGWYLDYGNGSKKLSGDNGVYRVSWDYIHHMGATPGVHASSYYTNYYNNSSTLFVYAHWEESEYHTVDITITGEGTSNITGSISICSEDSVRYLLKPASDWCLAEIKLNGVPIDSEYLIEAINHGLVLKDVGEDVSIEVTFAEGVYLSLKYGENIKTAYILAVKDGESRKFYDGDVIPADYFSEQKFPFRPITPGKELFLRGYKEETTRAIGTLIPVLPFPGLGIEFTLVIEVFDDSDGYTYIPENAGSYLVEEKGIFKKSVFIEKRDKIKEINVGAAVKTLIESVDLSYSVGPYVEDHYISSDIKATGGDKNHATYDAGQIVYLFIKKPADTAAYSYSVPDSFTLIGDLWYRMPIYVNSAEPDLGMVTISRERKSYTVTWNNWDGSLIYSEKYYYGERPIFNNKNAVPADRPVRPDDGFYRYVFTGWDKKLVGVNGNATYTAEYDAVLLEYVVSVLPTENGSITPNGENTITRLDRHTYIFTPDHGYTVKDVIVNGDSVGAVLSYTFFDVSSDQTLRVEFERIKYTVTVICDENGGVDRMGAVQIGHGLDLDLNITPDKLFAIDHIKVDGVPVDITNTLTVRGITKDTLVEIAFRQVAFSITTSSSGRGKISESSEVALGESLRVDFSPKFGYRLKDVVIDGVSIGAVDHYVFADVNCNHNVFAEYEIDILAVCIMSASAAMLTGGAVLTVLIIKKRNKRMRTQ